MGILMVKERLRNGHSKTWKLDNSKQTFSWGRSSQADLVSINSKNPPFMGIIEYRDEAWRLNLFTPLESHKELEIKLDGHSTFRFNDQEVEIEFIDTKESLVETLKRSRNVTHPEKAWQVGVVSANGVILSTKIEAYNKAMQINTPAGSMDLGFPKGVELEVVRADQYTIFRKLVDKEDLSHLNKLQLNASMDPESRKVVFGTGLLALLLVVGALLTPKKEAPLSSVLPMTVTQAPIIMKMPKELKKKAESAQKAQKSIPEQTVGAKAPSAGAQKITSMFKGSDVTGRISKLLSKVSAQSARTTNVINVKTGVVAGVEPSGRALAALGNVERPGKNWGSATPGDSYAVSTVGKSGKGAAGYGKLTGGSAGKAGVGLIEEETEISGGLDREIIAQYIKSQLGQILYCYERQLSASPDLFGKVSVRFTIGSSGAVETQGIGDTTLKNATVEGCILNKVAKWKFPIPQGGTKVMVTYPFLFKSTN